MKLNIGIIGMGFMGRAHSNAWSQLNKFFDTDVEICLKAVACRDKARGEAFAKKWGYESVETDWRAMIARDDIDVVDILTPTYAHKEMAVEAMKAGKHVICEKPCALTWQECHEMAEVAKETGSDLVDMYRMTHDLLERVGKDEAMKFFVISTGYRKSKDGEPSRDVTHPIAAGAKAFSRLFLDDVRARGLSVSACFR